MPRVPHKKIKKIIQSAWHVSENAQSDDLGGILKQFFLQGSNLFFFLQGAKPKVPYITDGKGLLTLLFNLK